MATTSYKPPTRTLHPLRILQSYLYSASCTSSQPDKDEILRVADFFYGSILEGALALLDDAQGMITKVTLVSTQPQRSLYMVKGQQTNNSSKGSDYYLCFIPTSDQSDTTSSGGKDCFGCCHCSCRSFLEKSRSYTSPSTSTNTTATAVICKHLLALVLLPALKVRCSVIETVSDDEFRNVVLSRLCIDY